MPTAARAQPHENMMTHVHSFHSILPGKTDLSVGVFGVNRCIV